MEIFMEQTRGYSFFIEIQNLVNSILVNLVSNYAAHSLGISGLTIDYLEIVYLWDTGFTCNRLYFIASFE